VAEIPRYRLEALAAALSCYDYRLEIGRVASLLGLSEQHTRLQLRRLRQLDEKLGYPSWAITDARWLGLRLLIVILGGRETPARQLSVMFEPGHVPWWRRVHWLPFPNYLAMLGELYGGAYMMVYRVPPELGVEIFDYFNSHEEKLGVKAIFGADYVPVRNCSGKVAYSAEDITRTYITHSKVFENEVRRGHVEPRLPARSRLLDVALYTAQESRPLARYADLDKVEVVALARGYPPAKNLKLKTRLVQRHYQVLSGSGLLGRAWLGPLLHRDSEPALVTITVPAECAEILYTAVAATLASPYIVLNNDMAFTVAYAPPSLQREISSFIAAQCCGEADTMVVTRYITSPMPVEMYDPEEQRWSRTPRNPLAALRRYGLLQPIVVKN